MYVGGTNFEGGASCFEPRQQKPPTREWVTDQILSNKTPTRRRIQKYITRKYYEQQQQYRAYLSMAEHKRKKQNMKIEKNKIKK